MVNADYYKHLCSIKAVWLFGLVWQTKHSSQHAKMFCLSWLVQFSIIFSFNSFTFPIANIFFWQYFGFFFYIFYPTFYFFNLSIWNFDLKLEFVNFQNSISQKKNWQLAICQLAIWFVNLHFVNLQFAFPIIKQEKKKNNKEKEIVKKIVNLQYVNLSICNL